MQGLVSVTLAALVVVACFAQEAAAARTRRNRAHADLRSTVVDPRGWMPDVAERLDELRRRSEAATAEALARRAATSAPAPGPVASGARR